MMTHVFSILDRLVRVSRMGSCECSIDEFGIYELNILRQVECSIADVNQW